ncbi:recombinase family protein [Streptomyces sp. NPDC001984]|uniref:recombinase family protein n=1 Tax=Streptomyces sp. NPDC002619 TaxID=3364655 RepID=UPI0036765F0E
MGAMFFAVLAAVAQIERNYIREKTLEGQATAAAKGNHGGRPKAIDDDSLLLARALKDRGVPAPEIAGKLTIKTGKKAGEHPSVASVYRALAEVDTQAETHIVGPRRPVRARITGPGSGTDPELMERLTRQILDGTTTQVLDDPARQTEDGTTDVVAQLPAQARDGDAE